MSWPCLCVQNGEFTGPPPPELWELDNVLITPHTSGGTEAELAVDQ